MALINHIKQPLVTKAKEELSWNGDSPLMNYICTIEDPTKEAQFAQKITLDNGMRSIYITIPKPLDQRVIDDINTWQVDDSIKEEAIRSRLEMNAEDINFTPISDIAKKLNHIDPKTGKLTNRFLRKFINEKEERAKYTIQIKQLVDSSPEFKIEKIQIKQGRNEKVPTSRITLKDRMIEFEGRNEKVPTSIVTYYQPIEAKKGYQPIEMLVSHHLLEEIFTYYADKDSAIDPLRDIVKAQLQFTRKCLDLSIITMFRCVMEQQYATSLMLRAELKEMREEIGQRAEEGARKGAKEVIDALKCKNKLLKSSDDNERCIILAAYYPKTKGGQSYKNMVIFHICSRFNRTSKDFLRQHKKCKHIITLNNMTCNTTDEVSVIKELGIKHRKVGSGNSKKYLVTIDEYDKLCTKFNERCKLYDKKSFVDDDSDSDDDTRLITDEDFESCLPPEDDTASLLETYLVMLKDEEPNDDNTCTTYFKVIYEDTYTEKGYKTSIWTVEDDNIIDKINIDLKLNLQLDNDGWFVGNLDKDERKAIRHYMK